MKINKFSLLLFLCLGFDILSAQPYAKFLDTKEWIIYFTTFPPSQDGIGGYVVNDHDSIVNGRQYRCLNWYGCNYALEGVSLYREDTLTRKVYEFVDSSEILLYSFASMIPGQRDTLSGQPCTLDSISIMNTLSGPRRLFYFTDSFAPNINYQILEGIGDIGQGGDGVSGCYYSSEWCPNTYFLLCCYDTNFDVIYTDPNSVYDGACSPYRNVGINEVRLNSMKVYPNPSNGLLYIKLSNYTSDANLTITDVLGRTVYNHAGINGISFDIDILGKSQGINFIRIEDKQGDVYIKKILIE